MESIIFDSSYHDAAKKQADAGGRSDHALSRLQARISAVPLPKECWGSKEMIVFAKESKM
jgi:hypothetical protein